MTESRLKFIRPIYVILLIIKPFTYILNSRIISLHMKKHLLFLSAFIIGLQAFAQITFEKGYFINNSNEKVDCLIKNVDWKSNPTEFTYKLSDNSQSENIEMHSVREFGINNISKYVRKTVDIDRSSSNFSYLTYNKEPDFNEERLFLKVLIEGKASLYEYTDGNLSRFFYTVNDSDVAQLVYVVYKASQNEMGKNNRYQQQLYNDLKCSTFTSKKLESLTYDRKDLVRFFVDYNNCNEHEYVNYTKKQKRTFFNLSIRPGINSSSLFIENSVSSAREVNFDNEIGFRLGIEGEFIMPFNKNKWAVIIEPTYQYYKSEGEGKYGTVNVDYKSIELPFGVRHYFFLNENSKIFANASYVIDFNLKSDVDFSFAPNPEVSSGNNFAFGLGYKYNNKYSLEVRYLTKRNLFVDHVYWMSEYGTTSVIFGYTLF